MPRASLLPLIAAAAVLAGCTGQAPAATVTFGSGADAVTLDVAVADTAEERREGLMFRDTVPQDGMLFVFPDAAPRTFWMKNTSIPLDIIFIQDGRVVNVAHAAPGTGIAPQALPRYRSDGPARYALEVPRGWADRHGVVAGTAVTVRR